LEELDPVAKHEVLDLARNAVQAATNPVPANRYLTCVVAQLWERSS
jgi:hypothetical protein